jgi:hypothetical protein
MILPLVVLTVTAAAVAAGIYLTLRGFKASEARANSANSAGTNGQDTGATPRAAFTRHDSATIESLKRFFDGKACAICTRPIPPVQRTGPKPGLLDPATHETRSWDEIPDGNTSAVLETNLPICASCQVAESFRQRFPAHVVERERSVRRAPETSSVKP